MFNLSATIIIESVWWIFCASSSLCGPKGELSSLRLFKNL